MYKLNSIFFDKRIEIMQQHLSLEWQIFTLRPTDTAPLNGTNC